MTVEPGLLLETLIALAAAAGAYAAIRADLARLHERSSIALASAARAHERLDKIGAGS